MRKLQKAALVVALTGSTALIGAAPAMANNSFEHKETNIKQSNQCRSHDTNVSLLNNIGILNGLGGNLLGGEGDPGAQFYEQGSDLSCSNEAY